MQVLRYPRLAALVGSLAGLGSSACGGGGGGAPTAPPTPPPETFSLSAVVYYDENANGLLDEDELGRLPGVTVEAGTQTGRTEIGSGRARVNGILRGRVSVRVRPESLPKFYVPGPAVEIDVPSERELLLPVTLPIGGNTPNLYLAFGDSITEGDGSSDDRGYLPLLSDRLRVGLGVEAELRKDAVSGSTTLDGEMRIGRGLRRNRPAYVLIVYGTNDWNPCDDVASCFTLPSLASMLAQARANQTLPALATIPPANTGFNEKAPPSRNEWVAEANRQIRAMAKAEGALLVDLEAAFLRAANGNLASLFVDHVHPSDAGYALMADEFYKALTQAPSPAATTSGWGIFFTRRPK